MDTTQSPFVDDPAIGVSSNDDTQHVQTNGGQVDQSQQNGNQPGQGGQPTTPTFDPNQFASTFAAEFAKQQKANQPQQQLTQEQLDEQLKVWKPNREYVNRLRAAITAGDDVKDDVLLAPILEMRDAMGAHYQAFLKHALEKVMGHIESQYGGAVDYIAQQRQQQQEATFYSKYKDLEPYRAMVDAAALQMKASGAKFQTADQAMEAVARAVEVMVKQFNPNFTLTATQQQKQTNSGGMPQLATLSTGGQGGNGNGQSVAKTGAADIW